MFDPVVKSHVILTCSDAKCVSMCFQDAKISSLERGMRELEEEVNMLKSNGALSSEEREEEIKQMEVYRSHTKFMKNKVTHRQTRHIHGVHRDFLTCSSHILFLSGLLWVINHISFENQKKIAVNSVFGLCHGTCGR